MKKAIKNAGDVVKDAGKQGFRKPEFKHAKAESQRERLHPAIPNGSESFCSTKSCYCLTASALQGDSSQYGLVLSFAIKGVNVAQHFKEIAEERVGTVYVPWIQESGSHDPCAGCFIQG